MRNPYLPSPVKIVDVQEETPTVKTYALKKRGFHFRPGQFVELTVFGAGEAPFSISSSPFDGGRFQVSVAKVFDPNTMRAGKVTSALHEKRIGEIVAIRGPYGTSYPIEEIAGKDVTIIGGGIGLAPLRSLTLALLHEREKYGDMKLLYGARTPRDLVFKKELEGWRNELEVQLTVDRGDEGWEGNVGVVTTLFDIVEIDPANNVAFVCGPPIMMRFVVQKLLRMGFAPDDIHLSLERLMNCGVGKCGHCNIGKYYVCKDGPVFAYEQVKDVPRLF